MPDLSSRRVLVTGGAGYIGSHIVLALVEAGYEPVIFDNFSNAHFEVVQTLQALSGTAVSCYRGSVNRAADLDAVLGQGHWWGVIHCAGLKAVGHSQKIPQDYFHTNVGGTAAVARACIRHNVRRLIFSSSCSIYGDATVGLITERAPAAPTNPYAWSKLVGEQMLTQIVAANPQFGVYHLRYFNPIGAHPSRLLGESPARPSPNIMPRLLEVAAGVSPEFLIHGGDYATPDGTCIRDYVHVLDIARAHVAAFSTLRPGTAEHINLGTGKGTSVRSLIAAVETASGREITATVGSRRPGDVPILVADSARAESLWGWAPTYSLAHMCAHAWAYYTADQASHRSSTTHPTE